MNATDYKVQQLQLRIRDLEDRMDELSAQLYNIKELYHNQQCAQILAAEGHHNDKGYEVAPLTEAKRIDLAKLAGTYGGYTR